MSNAQRTGRQAEAMLVLWSSAAPSNWSRQSAAPNLVLSDRAQSAKELAFLLDKCDGGHPCLLMGADQSGPGHLVSLAITGSSLRLAEGPGETVWIGGLKNPSYSFTAGRISDAYLAKIDRQGKVIWEREFGGRSERDIQSMVPLSPSGDVVVAGKYNERTWLARIAADGQIVWERFVGVGKGTFVTTAGDKIAVVAFEASPGSAPPPSKTYRDDLSFWSFDETGKLLDHRVMREGMNHLPGSSGGKLRIESSGDAIYVFSERVALSAIKPLEVIKINSEGQPVWRKELSETVVQQGHKTSSCSTATTVLASGDPLVACTHFNEVQLFQLHSQTGEFIERWVEQPLPPANCGERWPPVRVLRQMADGIVWLFGYSSQCMWLGQISLNRLPSAH